MEDIKRSLGDLCAAVSRCVAELSMQRVGAFLFSPLSPSLISLSINHLSLSTSPSLSLPLHLSYLTLFPNSLSLYLSSSQSGPHAGTATSEGCPCLMTGVRLQALGTGSEHLAGWRRTPPPHCHLFQPSSAQSQSAQLSLSVMLTPSHDGCASHAAHA